MKDGLTPVIALTLVMIVGSPLVARAQGPVFAPPPPPHTIEVTGHGEVRITPDLAMLNFAIETHGDTADEAARRNAALAQKVTKALESKLGEKGKGKIWTAGYNLFPDYAEQRIIGYRAENAIYVETTATDEVGALIDAGIAAGSNRVNSVSFGLHDDTKARSEAIAKASADAQAQAQALANSLGIKLKGVFRATTEGVERPMPVMGVRSVAFAAAEQAPTPIKPSEVTVPATVSLTYEIQ